MNGEKRPQTTDHGRLTPDLDRESRTDEIPVATGSGLEVVVIRGCCSECGWTYPSYQGHIEPCPRCALEEARHVIAHLVEAIMLRDGAYPSRHPHVMERARSIVACRR
jgi:hypothetical protein